MNGSDKLESENHRTGCACLLFAVHGHPGGVMFCIKQEAQGGKGGGSRLSCPSVNQQVIIGQRMDSLVFFFERRRTEGGAQGLLAKGGKE